MVSHAVWKTWPEGLRPKAEVFVVTEARGLNTFFLCSRNGSLMEMTESWLRMLLTGHKLPDIVGSSMHNRYEIIKMAPQTAAFLFQNNLHDCTEKKRFFQAALPSKTDNQTWLKIIGYEIFYLKPIYINFFFQIWMHLSWVLHASPNIYWCCVPQIFEAWKERSPFCISRPQWVKLNIMEQPLTPHLRA